MINSPQYYELPDGQILKQTKDGVFAYDPARRTWKEDAHHTSVFAWDRPCGKPCAHLRQKADLSDALPPFPAADAFYPGAIVQFGAYPQESANDFSPIRWLVLQTDGETALCIALECLITAGYCDHEKAQGNYEAIWWENSQARAILNGPFYQDAFSKEEKARILPRTLCVPSQGKPCADPVFLLSEQEVLRYFPEPSDRRARASATAWEKALKFQDPAYVFWWILPQEDDYPTAIYPKAVCPNGAFYWHGRLVCHPDYSLRPCVQIRYAESGRQAAGPGLDAFQVMRSRYEGCLLGGAVGDALGYPVEFLKEAAIRAEYGPQGIRTLAQAGRPAVISDDTQMTLFAANAIVCREQLGGELMKSLWTAYCEWLGTQGDTSRMDDPGHPQMWVYNEPKMHARRAPGNTCLAAIRNSPHGGSIQQPVNGSKGCGAVMRAAPFGLAVNAREAFGDGAVGVYKMAVEDAALTHGHPMAWASSCALAQMIYHIVQQRPGRDYRLEEVVPMSFFHMDPAVNGQLQALLRRAVQLAQDKKVSDLDGIHALGEGWVAEEALAIAVFCAVRYQDDFAAAIRAAVNHSGDSDSTGAICGNILGAWLGRDAVETAFDLNDLELREVIVKMADQLYDAVNAPARSAPPVQPKPAPAPLKPLRPVGLMYTPLTKKALQLCFSAHRHQMDKSGLPYAIHPLHLAEQMETEAEVCAALLHDTVEDGGCTLEDLRKAGMPNEVVEAVRCLTRNRQTHYLDYIVELRGNPIARRVKLADLAHNSDLDRLDNVTGQDRRRVLKYRMAQAILADDHYDEGPGCFCKQIPLSLDQPLYLFVFYTADGTVKKYAIDDPMAQDFCVVIDAREGERLRRALAPGRTLPEALADWAQEGGGCAQVQSLLRQLGICFKAEHLYG